MTLEVLGRFVWKLLLVLLVTLAAMALIGLIVRAVFGLDTSDVR